MAIDAMNQAATGALAVNTLLSSAQDDRAAAPVTTSQWRGHCLQRLFADAAESIDFRVRTDGQIEYMCDNLRRLLGHREGSAEVLPLTAVLQTSGCEWVMRAGSEAGCAAVLQLRDGQGFAFSVRAVACRRADSVQVLGLLTADCLRAEHVALHAVNNELAVTSRELARQRRHLESLVGEARAREAQLLAAYDTIEKIARTDPLTGLQNRRVLDDELPHLLRQAQIAQRPLSVLVVDLDHFKHINDSFGHDAGDQVLAQVANVLRRTVREDDLAVRLGGEEMMVVLPGASAETALAVGDNLRAAIEHLDFGRLDIRVTASIGSATWGGNGDELAALLARADTAMYQAKARGRNRCVQAPSSDLPMSVV